MTDTTTVFFDVQQKTDKQHILDNPDTYIGSVEQIESPCWVFAEEKIVEKNITLIPGLFKLFDEGIVNCRDHVIRMQSRISDKCENALPVTYVHVNINVEDNGGTITMTNDGNGMDVVQKDGIWIPELVFGHLRTSTNYNKDEKKIVGGKNGFGFKLVLIWSTYGCIETVDHIRGLKYVQEYKNNLEIIEAPTITKCAKKPYTKITFRPDYARLGIPAGLTEDMIALFQKRVYDISAITDKSIKVKYNDVLVPVKNFQKYVDMYIGENTRAYETNGDRWEYAAALSPNQEYMQVSFVNGIHTAKGGKHVEYILNQITRKIVDYVEKKKKIKVNPNAIKEQLILFVRCDIENPAFDSQTKDYMNTPIQKFGSKCEVSDKFVEKLAKMGVMEIACALSEIKETKVAKRTDGSKTKSIRGIPKLTDANWAGTEKSKECILLFCEGDSAKAGILSGLTSEDRNIIGVYPLKGKILNVRGESMKKISENKEIAEIKKILGLETGKEYKTIEDVYRHLRYCKVVFVTDQDLDGSHIKGLGINLFKSEWPALSMVPGFIGFMNTPIVKAKKGTTELSFYNNGEYNEWKNNHVQSGWKIKYYKGLGTSTGKEFREYFEKKKLVSFHHTEKSDDVIDMIFNKKRADERKEWLRKYNRDAYLDTNRTTVSYEEFIDEEFIHFSKYDCDRSIPNLMDGLKISLRKILFSAFKKNLTTEIKVAQFSGYVSEHSGYHHGEASLNAAIVGMAQNFVGSNNIHLFLPNGQFGSRLQGGKDSASERYIYTQLNKITRVLFPAADDPVLQYLSDDGLSVEPLYYAPILPMILINGSKGIGTGFSTEIVCYHPLHLLKYIENKLQGQEEANRDISFIPYYEGFRGTVSPLTDGKFLIKGIYEKIGEDVIRVTELPVGFWTDNFKEMLENYIEPGVDKEGKRIPSIVKDYHDMSNEVSVDFTITFVRGKLAELEQTACEYGCNGLEKAFKLFSTHGTSNMHLFDDQDVLQKINKVTDIIDTFYETRLRLYETRKKYIVRALEEELVVLSNKTRYIQESVQGTLDLRKKNKEEVTALLKSKGYMSQGEEDDYKYLIKMPMDSVTEENVAKLMQEYQDKQQQLATVRATSERQMWLHELGEFEKEYAIYRAERMQPDMKKTAAMSKKKVSRVVKNQVK